MQLVAKTLQKFPDDDRWYSFDFSTQPEMDAGQQIVSAVVTSAPPGPTIGIPAPAGGTTVQVELKAGNPGRYLMECLATTDVGAKIAGYGWLQIVDPLTL